MSEWTERNGQWSGAALAEGDRVRSEIARLGDDVGRAIARRCRDVHEIEDVVQESLYRALRKLDGLHAGAPVWPWLTCIARNVLVDRARADGGAGRVQSSDVHTVELFSREPEPCDAAEPMSEVRMGKRLVSQAHASAALESARRRLVEFDRQLLDDYYGRGLGCRESGRRLGLGLETTKVRLFRARNRLRRYLERELDVRLGAAESPAEAVA